MEEHFEMEPRYDFSTRKGDIPYELFNSEDVQEAYGIANRAIPRGKYVFFYWTLKLQCMLKLHKNLELEEIIPLVISSFEPFYDMPLYKILSNILLNLGCREENMEIWEKFYLSDKRNVVAGEELFLAHLSLIAFNEMQTQAMELFQIHKSKKYAEWVAYTLYLMVMQKESRNKMLGIASLFLIKASKTKDYIVDKYYVSISSLIETTLKNYDGALTYLKENENLFTKWDYSYHKLNILRAQGIPFEIINEYFRIFKNHPFETLPDSFQDQLVISLMKCAKLLLHDHLLEKPGCNFKANFDYEISQTKFDKSEFKLLDNSLPPIFQVSIFFYSVKEMKNLIEGKQNVGLRTIEEIRRITILIELEIKFWVALHQPEYKVFVGSSFYNLVITYIEQFYQRYNIHKDLFKYVQLFDIDTAAQLLYVISQKVDKLSITTQRNKFLRMSAIFHILKYTFGHYSNSILSSNSEKLNTGIKIMFIFEEAHTLELTEVDRRLFDELALISIDLINRIQFYDKHILNPYNLIVISLLQFIIQKSPFNHELKIPLLVLYSKLGLSKAFYGVWDTIRANREFARKYSFLYSEHSQEFGFWDEMAESYIHSSKYQKYSRNLILNNNCSRFKLREYEEQPNLRTEELYQLYDYDGYFTFVPYLMSQIRLKSKSMKAVQGLCKKSEERSILDYLLGSLEYNYKYLPHLCKINDKIIELPKDRSKVMKQVLEEGKKIHKFVAKKDIKKCFKMYGIRHQCVIQFFGNLAKSLLDATSNNSNELILDLDEIMLLQNQLNVFHLEKSKDYVGELRKIRSQRPAKKAEKEEKSIMNIYAKKKGDNAKDFDEEIENLLPEPSHVTTYLMKKLMDYDIESLDEDNFKIVKLAEKIREMGKFPLDYRNAKEYHNAFLNEFKSETVQCINLLLDSVNRLLLTINRKREKDAEAQGKPNKVSYDTKLKTELLEETVMGWQHLARVVEITNMSITELVGYLIPNKKEIRQLLTLSGTPITMKSHFTLAENRHKIQRGNKYVYEYSYDLQIEEWEEEEELREIGYRRRMKGQEEAAPTPKEYIDYSKYFAFFDDYNLSKHNSIIFFLDFAIMFTCVIGRIWHKLVPRLAPPTKLEKAKDKLKYREKKYIVGTRSVMRSFILQLIQHLHALKLFLNKAKEEYAKSTHLVDITKHELYNDFRRGFPELIKREKFVLESIDLSVRERIEHIIGKTDNYIANLKALTIGF